MEPEKSLHAFDLKMLKAALNLKFNHSWNSELSTDRKKRFCKTYDQEHGVLTVHHDTLVRQIPKNSEISHSVSGDTLNEVCTLLVNDWKWSSFKQALHRLRPQSVPYDKAYRRLKPEQKAQVDSAVYNAIGRFHEFDDFLTSLSVEDTFKDQMPPPALQAQTALYEQVTNDSSDPLVHSFFSQVFKPAEGNLTADAFYDGSPSTYRDLASDFDIPRDEYVREEGIHERIFNIVGSNEPYVRFILISSDAGAGKTTLLRRAAFDLATDNVVFELDEDWETERNNHSLQRQIKDIASRYGKCVFILDNAADCIRSGQLHFAKLVSALERHQVLFILAEQKSKYDDIISEIEGYIDRSLYFEHDLHRLTIKECEALAGKMIALEWERKLVPAHLPLSKSERVSLCVKEADFHFVVAMLQLRYGKRFRTIITDEIDGLPDKAQEAYIRVCFFNVLNIHIEGSLLYDSLELNSSAEIKKIKSAMSALITVSRTRLKARHARIAREVCRANVSDKDVAILHWKKLFGIAGTSIVFTRLLADVFRRRGLPRKLINFFEGDSTYVKKALDAIETHRDMFNTDLSVAFLGFKGQLLRAIGLRDEAIQCFRDLVRLRPFSGFAYRQLAHIEHEQHRFVRAATDALDSEPYARTSSHFLQIATVLSTNTVKNFYNAEDFYYRAINSTNKKGKQYRECRQQFNRFLAAVSVQDDIVTTDTDELISSKAVQQLHPKLKVFQYFFDKNTTEYKNELIHVLDNAFGNLSLTLEAVKAEIGELDSGDDPLVAKAKSRFLYNQGKHLFRQWYLIEEFIEPKDIENLFKSSLMLSGDDAFTHTRLGSYYKDIGRDPYRAWKAYRTAVDLAEKSKDRRDKHPIFKNNQGLLIVQQVEQKKLPPYYLHRAKLLFAEARDIGSANGVHFNHPDNNLKECDEAILKSRVAKPDAAILLNDDRIESYLKGD